MTLDDLADVLRRRDCDSVWYFHTDHFEPWSLNIDDESARAVDRMAQMARTSPFARKLSLFYAVFVPYRLDAESDGAVDGDRVAGDRIAFGARSAEQEKLACEAIRPLVIDDGHELHLHVHHEYWTRNTSNFDNPVSHWVNACSTPDADRQRLDLYFRLCCEAIASEVGRPFDRWGFIHGNWALNGSDHRICLVDDELTTLMRHGGFGDFSFPAGRGGCDPHLEAPFTCRPLPLPRVYDDPRAEPQAVGAGAGALRPDRFFIWNSPIKSGYSSIDYYSKANRELFKTPERIVAQWLGKSVVLDRCLFLKTHAHSMKWEYRVAEPDAVIPHCYPAVGRVFDCLARVCDRAGVELRPVTVNEVMARLREFDVDPAAPPLPTAPPEVGSMEAEQTVARTARSSASETQTGATVSLHVLKPPFTARGGAAWTIALPATLHAATDTAEGPNRSPLLLLEDGAPLGPGHAPHRDICEKGQGRYSFWKTGLWFSTADGSDPNRNGRAYAIAQERRQAMEAAPSFGDEVVPVPAADAPANMDIPGSGAFSVFGDLRLSRCPVCRSSAIVPLWRMPMATLREPIELFGGYFNQVPTLQVPSIAYCFDLCSGCESIFLNPVPSRQKEQYRTTDHYVHKMENEVEWQGYEDVYDSFAKWIPADATVMVDAACGVGQYLHVARQRGTRAWRRMVGLELAESYVRYMREHGFEAYAFDLDKDDLAPLIAPGSVDFITFCEAFEHVERPLDALRQLVAALRPGGRLYFTAQRYGADVQAAVRPGEPIYIGEKAVARIPAALGCRIVNLSTSSMRYFIVLEK